MRAIFHIGRYTKFIRSVLRGPDKWNMFYKMLVKEMGIIGIDSLGIVVLLATFMGAVMCLQTAHQVSGWYPAYIIGFTVRQTMILEFSPTLIPIILAS